MINFIKYMFGISHFSVEVGVRDARFEIWVYVWVRREIVYSSMEIYKTVDSALLCAKRFEQRALIEIKIAEKLYKEIKRG